MVGDKMVVVEIEDYNGNRMGSCQIKFDDMSNDYEIYDIDGEFDIADIDFDDIYATNDRKIRLQQNTRKEKVPFLSLNIESGSSPEEQEIGAYKKLKQYYLDKDYYYCFVMIWNYFGHIDYGRLGYYKTHGEIVGILIENLLVNIQQGNPESGSLIRFIDDMIYKIDNWLINK